MGSPGTIGGACYDQVYISEINYNSHPKLNSEDWIELSNNSIVPVNITGYKLYNGDSTKSFVIPNSPLIFKGEYLVLVYDSVKFKLAHPNTPFVGNITFNLKNSGDGVKLYSTNKNLSAWASFDTSASWPQKAIGGGYTLERANNAAFPNLSAAWFAGCLGGSPNEPYQACINNLVISEINYHPSATFDVGKWIELHNRSITDTINLSGMSVGNSSYIGDYIFAQNTLLYPNQFIVLASDTAKFNSQYSISNLIGNIQFNLNNTDELNIYNANGILMHTMTYANTSPWPTKPDGLGYTLEFNNTALDQSLASNWSDGCFGGSPGTGIQPCISPLLVTEINYHSHPKADADDWLEVMNHSAKALNLKGWSIKTKSNNVSYNINNNLVLNPSERLVLASDSAKFMNIYIGFNHPIVYGLQSLVGKDEIELYNPQGVLMSTQIYDSAASWPAANGTAYTLERIDTTPVANNSTDWFTVCPGGSPGTAYINCATNISITEINYNSTGQVNTGDWIELKNNSTIPAAIAGFRLINSDSLVVYPIAKTDLLFKDERYVLSESLVNYTKINGAIQVEGPTNIDFKNGNETIKIYNDQNELAASVHYNHTGNWPQLANGKGRTLEYTRGNASDASSWIDGCIGGSPAQAYVPCIYPFVFSEINYESSPNMNTGDWLELQNRTTQNKVLDGYTIKSKSGTYTFPTGTIMAANGYWVITRKGTAFDQWWSNVSNQSGDMSADLQSADELALYDSTGRLVYMFDYTNASPWPTNVDGTGRTMELADTAKDPLAASNWFAGCYGGTPGQVYTLPCVYNGVKDITELSKGLKLYPNPNHGIFTLELASTIQAEQLEIYNLLGEKVYTAKLQSHFQIIDLQHLAQGIYTLRVTEQGKTYQLNWVKE
ncbi:MAG: lamin tail domain-containing protein, partial [Bacteroidetes bacterium]|nr:lamin tail domain-containing protein [Bacteroidota bacterium]